MNTLQTYLSTLKAQNDSVNRPTFLRMVLANDHPLVITLKEVKDDFIVGRERLSTSDEIFPIGGIVQIRDVGHSREHTW